MKKSNTTTERLVKRAGKKNNGHDNSKNDDADVKGTNVPDEEVDDEIDVDDTEIEGGLYYLDLDEAAEEGKHDGRYTIVQY